MGRSDGDERWVKKKKISFARKIDGLETGNGWQIGSPMALESFGVSTIHFRIFVVNNFCFGQNNLRDINCNKRGFQR